jgi:hypothetical protein
MTLAAAVLLTVAPIAQQGRGTAPAAPAAGQGRGAARPAQIAGRPNLNGVWQAVGSAHWNLEDHSAAATPFWQLGAMFAIPAGQSVIVGGGTIPYLPAGLKKREENMKGWPKSDPEAKCYMAGIPRSTYMPYPFQIVQSTNNVLMAYEFASASRVIRMGTKEKSPAPAWMGWSVGRWDGDTLVVEVTDHMEETWFDRAGNHHSDALKVTERYTLMDANTINYEATIEDPKTFTKPWKMRMPIYRHREPNAQLMEYKCVEFAEELMYGHLRKQPTK